MRVLKIKIGDKYTKIKYSKKVFKDRIEAIMGAILHLESLLKKYKVKWRGKK